MPHFTLGEHFCPIPLPNSTAPHTRGTLLPLSVAQRGITARSGNTSTRFRRPTVPRRTLGEHLCHYPSPNGALPHARGTLRHVSVAQGCRAARPGDTYVQFRLLTAPRRTPERHFRPFPSPNGAAPHARATPTPVSVAGEGGHGKRTGMAEYGGRTGGGAGPESGPGAGKGTGTSIHKGAPDVMRRPGLPEARRRPTLPTGVSVPSARAGLTALFGMGRGGTPRLKPPRISLERSQRDNDN